MGDARCITAPEDLFRAADVRARNTLGGARDFAAELVRADVASRYAALKPRLIMWHLGASLKRCP